MKTTQQPIAEGILFTDEYQFTMAQLYFQMGLHENMAQFDHFFRSYPDYGMHQAGYCINAGLEWLLDWMHETHFRKDDIELLRGQTSSTGNPLFSSDFLDWLAKNGSFDGITMHAIPEGRVVHPNVPLTVVQGPLAMAQILETPLLNQLNFQTLIATKASRIHESGGGQTLLEFGLRRAQGKAANAGARAALIGGADFTSNVGISHVLGYAPKGTHAHSMVQIFMTLGEGELGAFRAYAESFPDDCLLLVDTIDTLESGVPNAIRVFEELKHKGHKPVGIRLDSGDLAYLSIQAAKMLNDAGFPDTRIVLSNQLDEMVIWQILSQIRKEAPRYGIDPSDLIGRLVYGVGTRLITSAGHAALDGVYKLVAFYDEDRWKPAFKVSETPAKTPNPGNKKAWRLYDRQARATADLLTLEDEDPAAMERITLRHPMDHTQFQSFNQSDLTEIENLLTPVIVDGRIVAPSCSIEEIRQRRTADLERLYPGVRRIVNPHVYHVSLSQKLWDLKQALIQSAREGTMS